MTWSSNKNSSLNNSWRNRFWRCLVAMITSNTPAFLTALCPWLQVIDQTYTLWVNHVPTHHHCSSTHCPLLVLPHQNPKNNSLAALVVKSEAGAPLMHTWLGWTSIRMRSRGTHVVAIVLGRGAPCAKKLIMSLASVTHCTSSAQPWNPA